MIYIYIYIYENRYRIYPMLKLDLKTFFFIWLFISGYQKATYNIRKNSIRMKPEYDYEVVSTGEVAANFWIFVKVGEIAASGEVAATGELAVTFEVFAQLVELTPHS